MRPLRAAPRPDVALESEPPADEPRPAGAIDLVALEPPTWWVQVAQRVRTVGLGRVLGGVATVAVAAVAAWTLLRPEPPRAEDVVPMATAPSAPTAPIDTGTTAPSRVVVHAAGAVAEPGVYELAPGARVTDLVHAAGGMTADADPDRLNLAEPLVDGSRIYVPRRGEEPPPPVTVDGAAPSGESAAPGDPATPALVDLNTASIAELEELPGIGPATAQAIVDHREQLGPFRSVDELLDVRGIGDAKLAQLRPLVTVSPP